MPQGQKNKNKVGPEEGAGAELSMGAGLMLVPYSEQEGIGFSPQPSSFGGPVLITEVKVYPLLLSSANFLRQRPGQESEQHALLCPRLWKRCCRSGVGPRVCRSQSSPGCPDFWSSFEDHTLSSWAGEAPGEIPGTPGSLPEGPTAGGTVIQLPCVCKPSSRVCVCVCVRSRACVCVRVCTFQSTSMYLTPLLLV